MPIISKNRNPKEIPEYIRELGLFIPHITYSLIEAAGFTAAMQLSLEQGGKTLYIPLKADGSRVEQIIGSDAAGLLCGALGPVEIEYVPLINNILTAWLAIDCGWNKRDIANRLRISRSTIYNTLAGAKKAWPSVMPDADDAA